MLSVDEARDRVTTALVPTAPEIVPLSEAWDRTTAAPIIARLTQPPADLSAMDGYAVRAADAVTGASLRVVGAAPAGHPFDGTVGPGGAVRLFTGSVMPSGADSVLLQENAGREGDMVLVSAAVRAGRNVRSMGQDFAAGTAVLPAGRRLGARDIGLAAAANHPWVSVHRRPVVAILSTGDEIAMPGEPIPPGGIVSSNAHALAALARAAGALPLVLPVAADDLGAIADAADGARHADVLVTTGGASVGDHDLMMPALAQRGFELDFWKIAMRPGKPLMHGRLRGEGLGSLPVLGLPGNPVSALICAVLFLLPMLDRLSGRRPAPLPSSAAVLGAAVPANDARADHLRAALDLSGEGPPVATPFPVQDSGLLQRLAAADALILRAPHAPALAVGTPVRVIRLDLLGI